MTDTKKMTCNDCGIEMNHHADKIDYTSGIADPAAGNLELGGVLEEFHSCPGCGKTALRTAT